MVDLTLYQRPDRRPCYVLRVAGLGVLYGTHLPPELQTNGVTHARRRSIVPDGINFSRSIDENKRVVTVDNLQLTLNCQDLHTSDQYDPGRVFSRLGYHGANAFAQITQTVAPLDVTINVTDSSNFAAGDIVHIAQETLIITSIVSGTQINVARGILGTIPRLHSVVTANGSFPYITAPLTYFRGRRVVVYEGVLSSSGLPPQSLGDYIEVFRGFFATEPSSAVSGMSHQITLELAPLTAVLDRPLASKEERTKLHPTLHAFDGQVANKILVSYCHNVGDLFTREGCIISQTISSFTIKHDRMEEINNRFDNAIAAFHPRGMRFVANLFNIDLETRLYLGPNSIKVAPDRVTDFYPSGVMSTLTSNQQSNNRSFSLKSDATYETKVCNVSILGTRTNPQVAQWRLLVQTRFNNTFAPGTINGLSGFLFDVTLDSTVGEVYNRPLFSRRHHSSIPKAMLVLGNNPMGITQAIRNNLIDATFLVGHLSEIHGRTLVSESVAGANAPQSGGDTFLVDSSVLPQGTADSVPSVYMPAAVLQLEDDDGAARVIEGRAQNRINTDASESTPVRLATGWFHMGSRFSGTGEPIARSGHEAYIVLASSVGFTSGSLIIEKGDELIAILEVSDGQGVLVNAIGGYRYRVDKVLKYADIDTIADYDGEEAHTVRPTISPTGTSIGELALRLLCSADGEARTSSTFDVFSLGAALNDGTGTHAGTFGADIDVESFKAIPNPIGAETFVPIFKDGDTILKVIEGLLNIANYTVDISTDAQGACRLRAVEIGLPDASNITATFDTATIAEQPIPSSASELSIKNIFKFSANYDHEDDAGVNITIRDQVSVDLFNESNELSIELRGVKVAANTPGDALHGLRPVFSKLRLENAYPRRVYTFDIPTSLLQQIALGDTCRITHPLLRGSSGMGIVTAPARVRSIDYDGFSATGSVELIDYGVAGSAWNTTLQVHTIISNNKLATTAPNAHSPTTRPTDGTAVTDTSGFFVGQKVRVISAFDFDPTGAGAIDTEVVAISSQVITVLDSCAGLPTDTLGFGFRAFIMPRDYTTYDSTSTALDYAFIGKVVST